MRAPLVGLAMLVLVTPPSVVLASNHTLCPSMPVRRNLPLRVVDGDTFRLHGERVRIVGIDTPERGEPGSARATYRLLTLLRSGPLTIVRHGHDVYCRTLAEVYVNGTNVATVMNAEGYAKPGATSVRFRRRAGPRAGGGARWSTDTRVCRSWDCPTARSRAGWRDVRTPLRS